MQTTLTKFFNFSASYENSGKIHAYNYRLGVTAAAQDSLKENHLTDKVMQSLISKVHSRDLGMHVDFLKNRELNDLTLLSAFWDVLVPALAPQRLHELSLQRDDSTIFTKKANERI